MIKAKEHLTVFTMVLYPMTKVTGITTGPLISILGQLRLAIGKKPIILKGGEHNVKTHYCGL